MSLIVSLSVSLCTSLFVSLCVWMFVPSVYLLVPADLSACCLCLLIKKDMATLGFILMMRLITQN